MKIDGYRCAMCGCLGTAENKLEVHHWSYPEELGTEDPYKSLITLCHIHHKAVHRMLNRPTCPDGTSSRIRNPWVPDISVYTISGRELLNEELEGGNNEN